MRVGLFNPYYRTMGGGERYFLTAAEFFLRRGNQVDIFWSGDNDIIKIKARFNLDLTGVNFIKDIFFAENENRLHKYLVTMQYDLIFFVSDGSVPLSLARKNILHFQVPFNHRSRNTLINKLKMSRISTVVCNSMFTKSYIDKTYGVASVVVYPPVDINAFPPGKKENIILSVGRFFGPMHPKKQEIMVKTFVAMCQAGLKDWQLVLIGGLTAGGEDEVLRLKKLAVGFPIKVITDSDFHTLKDYYSRSKIYWHATGFGEDQEIHPERTEHFGITTVEAMSAGCVPIVFAAGGQLEIINEDKNGLFWKKPDELIANTMSLINSPRKMTDMAVESRKRSRDFSQQHFFNGLEKVLSNQ